MIDISKSNDQIGRTSSLYNPDRVPQALCGGWDCTRMTDLDFDHLRMDAPGDGRTGSDGYNTRRVCVCVDCKMDYIPMLCLK